MYKKALSIYEIIGRSFNATYWQNNHVSFSHFLLEIKIDPNKTNHLHIIITLYGVIKHPLLVCPSAHVNGFKNLEFAQTQLKKGSSLYIKKNKNIDNVVFCGFFYWIRPLTTEKKTAVNIAIYTVYIWSVAFFIAVNTVSRSMKEYCSNFHRKSK